MPQFNAPPQPSAIEPQVAPSAAQVVGVQVGVLQMPPDWQIWPLGQLLQSMVPPQPFAIMPQRLVQSLVVKALHVGAVGISVVTHEPRSNSMYSSTFSCALRLPLQ
jgi:hypothetical protein